jgi:TIR domain
MTEHQIFVSYSGRDAFEASLLQYALESILASEGVVVWTFQRDQKRSEKAIAKSLKDRVRESSAVVFLVSPETLESGSTQWMELAYADAFDVETFICLVTPFGVQRVAAERSWSPSSLARQPVQPCC